MKIFISFLVISLGLITATGLADTLVLKNGLSLEGKFKGGNETVIKFETSGAVQEVAISEIKSLTFSAPETKAKSNAAAAPAAAAATAGTLSGTKIPAGTKLTIQTLEDISTASYQAGAIFRCALELDLILDGTAIAPKGSEVYGVVLESIGGRRIGNQRILVSFNKISLNGQMVAMETDDVGAEGGRGGAARAVVWVPAL